MPNPIMRIATAEGTVVVRILSIWVSWLLRV